MKILQRAGAWLAVGAIVAGAGWGFRQYDAWSAEHRSGAVIEAAPSATRLPAPVLQVPAGATADAPVIIRLDAALARQALRDGQLRIALPDGTTYPVKMERQATDETGHWSVVGRVDSPMGPQAMVLTFGANAVFGVVPTPHGRALQITTGPGGMVSAAPAGGIVPIGQPGLDVAPDYIVPRDDTPLPRKKNASPRAPLADQATPLVPPSTTTSTPGAPQIAASPATAAAPIDTTPVEINVLALYSTDLPTLRGSVAAAETEVANLFAITNQAHIDSGSRVRLKAVGLRSLAIPPSFENAEALSAIGQGRYSDVDLEGLRDTYAADLVAFVRPYLQDDPQCGTSYLAGAGYGGTHLLRAERGYIVANVAPCGPYVFAHELGHAMGSVHDRTTQSDKHGIVTHGAFPFSFGFRTRTFGTIMADVQDRTWLGRYSSAERACLNMPCGVAERIDNVRSLNLMAPAIANYRRAPNTAWISDVASVEGHAGGNMKQVSVPIRLSMPAPPNGLTFQVQVTGGTATAMADYRSDMYSSSVTVMGGQRSTVWNVMLLPDDAIEGDETIQVHLVPPAGVTLSGADATVMILDEDPRPVISGRLRLPEGVTLPYLPHLYVYGAEGNDGQTMWESTSLWGPDYTYSIPVAPGAPVQLVVDFGTDRVYQRTTQLNEVWASRTLDIVVDAASELKGKVRMAPGMVAPPFLDLHVKQYIEGELRLEGPPSYMDQEGNYIVRTLPGATVELFYNGSMTPTAGNTQPFRSWHAIVQRLWESVTLDPEYSSVTSVVAHVPWRVKEGATFDVTFERAAMLPASPVQFRWRTVDGSARAGVHYVAATGTARIESDANTVTIQVETVPESVSKGGRYFDIVMDQFVGATASTPIARVWLVDDDARASGPLVSDPQ
jgi:hypothetical protein